MHEHANPWSTAGLDMDPGLRACVQLALAGPPLTVSALGTLHAAAGAADAALRRAKNSDSPRE